MQVTFTFRNMDSSEAIKNFATEKISRLEKYMRASFTAEVTFSMERHSHCVDITVVEGANVYQGTQESADMYASIDMALSKVDRQIRRLKAAKKQRKRTAIGLAEAVIKKSATGR